MSLFSMFVSAMRTRKRRPSLLPAQRKQRARRLMLEALEDRALPSCNVISGYVFNDVNNNGIYDAGETPLANSTIQLLNASNTVIGTATTDAHGFYQFATDSTISTAPTTLTRSASVAATSTDWSQMLNIAQFDPNLGTLTSIDIINAGTFTSQIRVESLDAAASTITATDAGTLTLSGPALSALLTNSSANRTFGAGAFDGTIDFAGASGHDFGAQTAPGTNSTTLTAANDLALFTGTGTVSFHESAHASSSASGAGNLITQISTTASAQLSVVYHYIPSNCLRPGLYHIVQTTEPAGYLDGLESIGGTLAAGSVGTDTITVTLANADLLNNNFAEIKAASISGFVYQDNNNNGVKETGELGIAGAHLTLTGADDLGGVSLTATTAADGSYSFGNLRPGTYQLSETQPAGYLDGRDTLGSAGGVLGNDAVSSIRLSTGTLGTHYDFGELLPPSLAGFVYVDANNNGIKDAGEAGIAGVALSLTGMDDLGASVSLVQTTAADGSYRFQNLRPGAYVVAETQPANYFDGLDTAGSAGGQVGNDVISSIVLGMGVTATQYNFGELPPGSLAGFVYLDSNNNGIKEYGESGIAGVTVKLIYSVNMTHTQTITTVTGSDGSYHFDNLPPGAYALQEVQPASYADGLDSLGSMGGTILNDMFANITLPPGARGLNYNFGERLPSNPTGVVYGGGYSPMPATFGNPDVVLLSKLMFLSTPGTVDPVTKAQATYIDGLYRTMLGRSADDSGLVYWLTMLHNGVNPLQVVQAIWNSTEHRAIEVNEFYLMVLGRPADAPGRAAWVNQLMNGVSEVDVVRQLYASAEYQNTHADNAIFVSSLYGTILQRSASADEIAMWTTLLQGGTSRAAVVNAFLTSGECYQHLIDRNYHMLLQRAPDAAGLQSWVGQLQSGSLTPQLATQLFLASGEFYGMAVRASQQA